MSKRWGKTSDIDWIEPVAALSVFVLALFVNRFVDWPWMWVVDLFAGLGAAISFRRPVLGAILTGLSLVFWLPIPTIMVSIGGTAFYVNIFAAARANLSWRAPLTLGFGGLAYLTLVRKPIADPSDRLTLSLVLLLFVALAYVAGTAVRYATRRIQREQDTGDQRVQDLQVALARELHDSVAQTLSSAAMRANIVMSDPTLSPLALGQLERISEDCRSSAHDLRQLLASLRDEPERTLPPGPLADVDSLRTTVNSQAERLRDDGFTVDVHFDVTKLSAARSQTLAAITIEAGNNILKHARPGTTCTFSIMQCDANVVAQFSNVRKDSRAARQGFGLTGVQERLALLDGTSRAYADNGRWTLQVTLPLGMETSLSTPSPSADSESMFSRPVNS